jgi:2-C-methyl-D-erythritol 4-phosphate cytidylyltransferase
MTTATILLAAGTGSRLGLPTPKAFVPLGGRTIVEYSLEAIQAAGGIDVVVLVVPPRDVDRAGGVLAGMPGSAREIRIVPGGETRQGSVRRGLDGMPPGVDVVLCHDAARPLASPGLFARVAASLGQGGTKGVVPVIWSPDTVKRVAGDRVMETVPRDSVGLVQTPQAFDVDALRAAHRSALAGGLEGTDDAMLLEAIGLPVATVEGEATNFKITTPDDLSRAEAILAARAAGPAGTVGAASIQGDAS